MLKMHIHKEKGNFMIIIETDCYILKCLKIMIMRRRRQDSREEGCKFTPSYRNTKITTNC